MLYNVIDKDGRKIGTACAQALCKTPFLASDGIFARTKVQTIQLRDFPVSSPFSWRCAPPTPFLATARARRHVRSRRLSAARKLTPIVGSSLLRHHRRRVGGFARAALKRPGPLPPAPLLLTSPPRPQPSALQGHAGDSCVAAWSPLYGALRCGWRGRHERGVCT